MVVFYLFSCVGATKLKLCGPVDWRLPGFSVHGISQVRILEWVASYSSKGSSQPKDRTGVSCIGRWILYLLATREAHLKSEGCALNDIDSLHNPDLCVQSG